MFERSKFRNDRFVARMPGQGIIVVLYWISAISADNAVDSLMKMFSPASGAKNGTIFKSPRLDLPDVEPGEREIIIGGLSHSFVPGTSKPAKSRQQIHMCPV